MIYFSREMSKEEGKRLFKKWAVELHPDKPTGSHDEFLKLQQQYERFLRGNFLYTEKEAKAESCAVRDFINANEFIKCMDGVTVELTGTWVWICGDTFKYKDVIKANGFKWSKSKKKWYKAPEGTQMKRKRGTNFNKIQQKYGYQKMDITNNTKSIA